MGVGELVLETKKNDLHDIAQIVQETMCEAASLKVPIETSVKVGRNWQAMEPLT